MSQQKNAAKQKSANKGNTEGLSATQRAERDAQLMRDKAAAKAAAKDAALAAGGAEAEKLKAEAEKKKKMREAKKDAAYANSQAGKANIKHAGK